MKNQKGISLIAVVIIIAIVIIGFIIISNSGGKTNVKIEWGYMPSTEYYELRVAGAGGGTLSQASFNTLGRDIKKAGGKWFKDSNVNFKASTSDADGMEITTLTDGTHTATFTFDNVSNYVNYTFEKKDNKGYKITIK